MEEALRKISPSDWVLQPPAGAGARASAVLFSLFLILILLLTGGCRRSGEGESPPSEQLWHAHRLIDDGRFVEAEQILLEMLEKSPGSERVRVTLASVYLAPTGLTMVQFADLAQALADLDRPIKGDGGDPATRRLQQQLKGEGEAARLFGGLVEDYSRRLKEIDRFLATFESIPSVSPEQTRHLMKALKVLREIPQPTLTGTFVFRGALEAVAVKALWRAGGYLSKAQVCEMDFQGLSAGVIRLAQDLGVVLEQLQNAFPNRSRSLQTAREDIAEMGKEAQSFLGRRRLTPADSVVASMLMAEFVPGADECD